MWHFWCIKKKRKKQLRKQILLILKLIYNWLPNQCHAIFSFKLHFLFFIDIVVLCTPNTHWIMNNILYVLTANCMIFQCAWYDDIYVDNIKKIVPNKNWCTLHHIQTHISNGICIMSSNHYKFHRANTKLFRFCIRFAVQRRKEFNAKNGLNLFRRFFKSFL